MRQSSLAVLACPICAGPLEIPALESDPILDSVLKCKSEGVTFPVRSGVPMLVRPSSIVRVEAFERSYAPAWVLEGWGASDEAHLLALPGREISGRRSQEWRVKARSMEALFALLAGPTPRRIVDLGCGTGWLAHHLARRGSDVFAVDIVRSAAVGLNAADAFLRNGPPFERIWGELEHPPFQTSSIDVVICNASLHYTSDLEATLREVARVLRPDGLFFAMNSPVHGDSISASRAERDFRSKLEGNGATADVASSYHHFVRRNLEDSIRRVLGSVHEAHFNPGRGFLVARRMKGIALGMELASFPILYATNEHGVAPQPRESALSATGPGLGENSFHA
jgi:SAM-dependent methyltransferase